MSSDWKEVLGIIGSVALPLFDIPLIIRIQRRKSSKDISLFWAVGTWICILLMLPSGLVTADPVYRVFTWVNVVLFTIVVFQVARFR